MIIDKDHFETNDNVFWQKAFFSGHKRAQSLRRTKNDLTEKHRRKIGDAGALWLNQLFTGVKPNQGNGDLVRVLKGDDVIYEISTQKLGRDTTIGRHPDADLQLESNKMAMFHAVIFNCDGKLYLENLDDHNGILVNRKKLPLKKRIPLYDGIQVDLPDYRLEFSIADVPRPMDAVDEGLEAYALDGVPEFLYNTSPPPTSPLLVNRIEDRGDLKVWSGGVARLKVVDIIEETHDSKTFRMAAAGVQPLLFSYKPGQFITFILGINGEEVRRSYSMSSSPSRPHLLEITIKRVPGGLVSNWFCDHVKLGDELSVKGPTGHFTCFDSPSRRILFIGAGSGITPILSMCRWIADTAPDIDVKLLASFKSPSDIIFRKEFEMLSARSSGFQTAITVTSRWKGVDFWGGFTGRVNRHMLAMFVPDILERDVFLCGPEPFSQSINGILREIGYDMSRFHTESYGSGRSAQSSNDAVKALHLKEPLHKVKFTKSGKVVDTDEHVTLLELAEAHGIEVDYSCRVGGCGECEMKCRGEVYVDPACEIDEKTRNAGFVYSCCTTARSDLELDI
ncbi:MAG: FAD-binding oxidoreductase [Methylomicrobium sp.]